MTLKNILEKTNGWIKKHIPNRLVNFMPEIDSDGLIEQQTEIPKNEVAVKTVQPITKNESFEKLQEGFVQLIDQLKGINEQLNRQAGQSEKLVQQMDKLPNLLGDFPATAEKQKQLTETFIEQLKEKALKDTQFIEAVEKIPIETAKQTDALTEIDHQLAASANSDVQMVENFNKFNKTIEKLEQTTNNQNDSIIQMSKTFATSDRYLKYLMSRQNKRFMWIFMIALGICFATILILTGIVIYLK